MTHVRCSVNGVVRGVGNPSEWWSPREVIDVVSDIESGQHRYVVSVPGHGTTTLVVTASGYLGAAAAAGEVLLSELPSF